MHQTKEEQFFKTLKEKGIILNETQIEFVRQKKGCIKVTAPGGSGKSLALAVKVAYLINIYGIEPGNILVITYTKNAAEELKSRLKAIGTEEGIFSGTIHSLCYHILSSSGLYKNLNHRLKSDGWRLGALNLILQKLKLDGKYSAQNIMPQITQAKNSMIYDELPSDLQMILSLYQVYKEQYEVMDFEDLLICTLSLFKSHSAVLELYQNKYTYIFLDEAQDSSKLEYELVRLLASPQDNLCILGDPAQSIFSFRGGDVGLMYEFQKYYPSAKEYFFNLNYRSTNQIVTLCNDFLPLDRRITSAKGDGIDPKFLVKENCEKEAEYIVTAVTKDRPYKDFAVLYRTTKAKQYLWDTLTYNNIPFQCRDDCDGIFYSIYHVKIILSHLRLIVNPYDYKAFYYIMPSLHIPKTFFIPKIKGIPPMEVLLSQPLGEHQYEVVIKRINAMCQCKDRAPYEAMRILKSAGGLSEAMGLNNTLTPATESILEDWAYLDGQASEFRTIQEFLTYIDGLTNSHTKEKSDNAVTLSTIHAAKGLSFPVVFLISAVDGLIPHKYSYEPQNGVFMTKPTEEMIAEERRLLYVALSRAEEELHILAPKERLGNEQQVSRFLVSYFNERGRFR